MEHKIWILFLILTAAPACSKDGPSKAPGKPEKEIIGGPGAGGGKPLYVAAAEGMRLWLCLRREDGPAENIDATIGFDEKALLGVVVEWDGAYYTDLEDVVIDGKKIDRDRMKSFGSLPGWKSVSWYKVESKQHKYMNSKRNDGWWADVEYVETLDGAGREPTREVDVRPLHLRGVVWNGRSVGTMRYKAVVELEGLLLASPGAESAEKAGTCPGVRRVSRMGGTGAAAVDSAMSLANLPYIWGSAPVSGDEKPGSHQAELYIGADCADLIVAAWHLSMASAIPFTGVIPLMKKFGAGAGATGIARIQNGCLYDRLGRKIPVGPGGALPGSAVTWRFGPGSRKGHAAMLAEDRGPGGKADGVLNKEDIVFHAMWNTPALARLGDVLPDITPAIVINPAAM